MKSVNEKMICIDLKLYVTLSKYLPASVQAYEITQGTSILDLIDDLSIPAEEVKLIFVNGKKQERDYVLEPDDRVGLFPPVGGG